jgi:murein DD-endopeptidase MepM/ murein hydrolase activator NlpD
MGKHAKRKAKGLGKKLAVGTALTTGAGLTTGVANAATLDEWETVAECESGGDWSIPYSSDGLSTGGLQFQQPSWDAALAELRNQGYDTSGFPAIAYQATKEQQILAGEALLHIQGAGAWVCSGLYSASMFDGGPDPFGGVAPDTGTTAPETTAPGGVAASEGNPSEVWPDHVHHTVEPGDTLYGITLKYTGDDSLGNWRHTYEINKVTVGDNPDVIFPGQDIRVDVENYAGSGQASSDEPSHSSYVHPVGGAGVSQVYGNPGANYTLGYHTGVDFSAGSGTEAVSVAAGTVVESDTSSAYGTNVQIQLADGHYALYAHLSGATVSVGDEVAPGDLVGYVGNTGTSSGPHLHFEIRSVPKFGEGNFLDPLQYLRDNGLVI